MSRERRERGEDPKTGEISTSIERRRTFIKYFFVTSFTALIGTFVSMFKAVIPLPQKEKPEEEGKGKEEILKENIFRYIAVQGTWFSDKANHEVEVEDFEVGRGALVLWRDIPAILIRADPDEFKAKEGVEKGFVAFCAKCTHLCCIPNYRIDRPDMDRMFCRCHDGIFDPYDIVEDEYKGMIYRGAKVVAGPPPRALPQIPVKIQEGKVMGIPSHMDWYDYCG